MQLTENHSSLIHPASSSTNLRHSLARSYNLIVDKFGCSNDLWIFLK